MFCLGRFESQDLVSGLEMNVAKTNKPVVQTKPEGTRAILAGFLHKQPAEQVEHFKHLGMISHALMWTQRAFLREQIRDHL